MSLSWRIVLGWLAFVTGLGLAVVIATVAGSYEFPTLGLQILLAVVTTSVSVPLIYLLRRYVDQRPWSGLGLSSPPSGFRYFLLGIGLLALITAAALLIGSAAGWLRIVAFHFPVATMLVILINTPIAFFYEAFPEELTFRGYVFRNLNTLFPRWLALLLQVILFVLAPIAVTGFMVALGIGTWDLITVEYIVNLTAFGTVLQLCRILSNNLWMNIGFHLAWLEMVRYVVVPSNVAFVEIEYLSVWGHYMITIGSVIIGIVLLIVWSLRSGNRIDWNRKEPDLPLASNPESEEAAEPNRSV
ncbi:CAAX protease [Bacillus sp. FJAT-18019]|nr:CAAX protease [Bacillus sp. FJAT-18019]